MPASNTKRCAFSQAVGKGEIWPAFQPIVSMDNGALIGFEILARWNSPRFGAILPDEFIPWAEEDGLIDQLTHNLIVSACTVAAKWSGDFYLGFNISPMQFNQDDMATMIFSAVKETGFPLHRLKVEMTEKTLIDENSAAHALLKRLNSAGVAIMLDDFGTGYSNLSKLQNFSFQTLKIDKSFVRNIASNMNDRKIVTAIIDLGTSLGLEVIAEGVEDIEQARVLQSLGCVLAQGWLYGSDMTSADAALFAGLHKPANC